MDQKTLRRAAGCIAAISVALVLLAGCSNWVQVESSRAEIYDSVDQLLADSSTVVVVTVAEQEVKDGSSMGRITISSGKVEQSFAPSALGAELDDTWLPADVGDVILIRQLGDNQAAPVPILTNGGQYLLFLTPTMLEGAAANEFYVTGAVAGIYRAGADSFVRVSEDPDRIPSRLTAADLQ